MRTACGPYPVSTTATSDVPGMAIAPVVSPASRSFSSKSHVAPAGRKRRPSGRTCTPGAPGSGPAYLIASSAGAVAVHRPGVTAGGLPSQGAHDDACGIAFHAPRFGHAYGVVRSTQV